MTVMIELTEDTSAHSVHACLCSRWAVAYFLLPITYSVFRITFYLYITHHHSWSAQSEGKKDVTVETLQWIHEHKTATLLEFCVVGGGILGGKSCVCVCV